MIFPQHSGPSGREVLYKGIAKRMNSNFLLLTTYYKNKLRLCQQPAFWSPMRQPPTGDKNKYEDQQRSSEGRAAVPAVGWLLLEREGMLCWCSDDVCLPDRFTRACVVRWSGQFVSDFTAYEIIRSLVLINW